jgi:hypothetical protein
MGKLTPSDTRPPPRAPDPTAAERQRAKRARKRAMGLRRIPVIVPEDQVKEIRKIAAAMTDRHKRALAGADDA